MQSYPVISQAGAQIRATGIPHAGSFAVDKIDLTAACFRWARISFAGP
jgi:hypothetical protein